MTILLSHKLEYSKNLLDAESFKTIEHIIRTIECMCFTPMSTYMIYIYKCKLNYRESVSIHIGSTTP